MLVPRLMKLRSVPHQHTSGWHRLDHRRADGKVDRDWDVDSRPSSIPIRGCTFRYSPTASRPRSAVDTLAVANASFGRVGGHDRPPMLIGIVRSRNLPRSSRTRPFPAISNKRCKTCELSVARSGPVRVFAHSIEVGCFVAGIENSGVNRIER